jgi:RNA polymerase sigma-70 factor, ECF subfamily
LFVNLSVDHRDEPQEQQIPMEAASDDRALIKAIAGGDAKALERLFARNQTRVFRYLTRVVRNEAVAEELMNEVFLAAWQSAGRYEGRSEPSTWLISIAHNKAVSSLRKKREVSGYDDDAAAQIEDDADTPEVTSQKMDKAAQMRAAMKGLSSEHREILDLVYYQEQSVSEAAEILRIPEATVKTRMFYARKKLSELLVERGVDRGWP